jgi:myo-inositol 2-dehydrogenase / D-chiro-inositol 1-dehydrogenase
VSGPVRLGLFGCGRAAERLHVPAIGPGTGTRLTGVFDPLKSRRELIASQRAGCRTYDSAASMIESGEIDALIIATPAETHVEMASLALRARLPVLVEKPLAGSLDDGERLAAMQASARVPLMMGLNRRWWRPAMRLRQRLAAEGRGAVAVRMQISSDVTGWSPLTATSDALDDLGTHQLDLLRFICGSEIESVEAQQPSPAVFQLQVRLLDGTIATCVAAYGERSAEVVEVSFDGQRICARVGSERIYPATGAARRMLDVGDTACRRILRRKGGLTRSYADQLTSFAACIRSQTSPSPGLKDGLAVLHAIDAARASLRTGGAAISPTTTCQL